MTNTTYTADSFTKQRRRPLKALRHFRELIRNKEDTTQVFYVIEALNGDSFQKQFVKFANSEKGRKRLEENRHLPPLLDNHDWLRTLPEGSLGRAYLHFMTTEGLTAQGLVDEYTTSGVNRDYGHAEMNIYGDRLRDTHDMLHVLTGFGRDALGEASVLGFSHAQHGGPGVIFIAYGAAWEVRKSAPKDAPVLKSIHEARRIGKAAKDIVYEDLMELLPLPIFIDNVFGGFAKDIVYEDLMELLPLPIEEVRAKLGIEMPTQYHEVHRKMRDKGMDPYAVIGTNAVAA